MDTAQKFLELLQKSMPLSKDDIAAAKSRISSLSLLQLQEIGLGPPDLPILRDSTHSLRPRDRLHALQHYISAFGYNHIFGYHFNTHKRRPFHQVMNTARDVIRDGLPIKCIEATFLGMLLTCKYPEWQRFPLGFKTKVAGHHHVYRHIVLLVHDTQLNQWGALGISRRSDLMFKPLTHKSLSSIVTDFKAAYSAWHHDILKVRIGLPVEHNEYSSSTICWRYCNINTNNKKWDQVCSMLDAYAARAVNLRTMFNDTGMKQSLEKILRDTGHKEANGRGAGTRSLSIGSLRERSTDSDSDSESDGLSLPSECSDSEDEKYVSMRKRQGAKAVTVPVSRGIR